MTYKPRWLTKEEKSKIRLPSEFKQLIDGTLLGDGTLKQECNYPAFCVEQKHEEFVRHLWEEFKKLKLVNELYKKRVKTDQRLNKQGLPYNDSITYRFASCSLPYFQKLMKKWYTISGEIDNRGRGKKTKTVPKDLKLTPIVLTYWLSSDGHFSASYISLFTNSFQISEVNYLINKLDLELNIKSILYLSKRAGSSKIEPIIKIPRSEFIKVIKLVKQFTCPVMLYKIGLFWDEEKQEIVH